MQIKTKIRYNYKPTTIHKVIFLRRQYNLANLAQWLSIIDLCAGDCDSISGRAYAQVVAFPSVECAGGGRSVLTRIPTTGTLKQC